MRTSFIPKIPLRPLTFTGQFSNFTVTGRSFYEIQAVYLSGYPYENTTFFNPFSSIPRLSATYPGFNAVKLLSSQYLSNNDNTITFTMPSATRPGYVDIIVQNQAGYGTLTQYVIKELYTGSMPLSTLRPWSLGIKVLSSVEVSVPAGQIYTISDDLLVTISNDNIVQI
jgi:hypothetical protein